MDKIIQSPLLLFIVSLIGLWFSAWLGAFFLKRRAALDDEERKDFETIRGATLTLLALIIGFSFSIAIGRYEQRRGYEEAEANAIGTEYLRVDFLATTDAVEVRKLLRKYLVQRILFYTTDSARELQQIDSSAAQLQADLWSAVAVPAAANPTRMMPLVVSGMNDVLNSQGYTQSAYRNRIPRGEWGLMALIAIFANLLVGYGSRRVERKRILLLALPVIVSVAFMLIADIDSPRGGLIHVRPVNLESLTQSLQSH